MASVQELTGLVDLSNLRRFSDVKKGFTRFRNGDLLFAKITPCMENGKVAVVRNLAQGIGCGSTEFHVIRAEKGVDVDYLRYYVVQSAFRRDAKRNMQGAVGQQRVPPDFLREASLPLAPEPEQKRIVKKVDELFNRIEEGERALERVQRLVDRYRQSVLKAAVTGELTRGWREKHKGKLESGEALLARILKARRDAWEKSERAKIKAKGQKPTNGLWKGKYSEPNSPRIAGLPELPRGWAWANAEQLCGFITKGTTPTASAMMSGSGDIPYIKVYNLTFDGSLDFTKDPTFISKETHVRDLARSRILPGDVLMNIVGPPLGKVSIVPSTHPEWNMNQAVAVFRPFPGCSNEFLALYVRSKAAQDWYAGKAKATAGQFNLTLEICRETPVPLPPLEEQEQIVQKVKTEESRLFSLLNEIKGSRQYSGALRQSALRAAFDGRILSQDPMDEPASVLLERIAAERAKSQKHGAPAKGRRKKVIA